MALAWDLGSLMPCSSGPLNRLTLWPVLMKSHSSLERARNVNYSLDTRTVEILQKRPEMLTIAWIH